MNKSDSHHRSGYLAVIVRALALAASAPVFGALAWQGGAGPAESHPCAAPSVPCIQCHSNPLPASGVKIPSHACSDYCITCHKELSRHHKVGMQIREGRRFKLKLTERHQVACTTCHNLEAPRYDTVPWKCQSLFDSVFRRAGSYRTYYLVTRNNAGQLCRNCH